MHSRVSAVTLGLLSIAVTVVCVLCIVPFRSTSAFTDPQPQPLSFTVDGNLVTTTKKNGAPPFATIPMKPGQTVLVAVKTTNLAGQACTMKVTGFAFPGTMSQYRVSNAVSLASFDPKVVIHTADCTTDTNGILYDCGNEIRLLPTGVPPVILYSSQSKVFRFSVTVPAMHWKCNASATFAMSFLGRPLGNWPKSCHTNYRSLEGSYELHFVPAKPCVK